MRDGCALMVVCLLLYQHLELDLSVLSIAVTFTQSVSVVLSLKLSWSLDVQYVRNYLSVLNLNLDMFSIGCSLPTFGYKQKFLFILCSPFIVLFFLACTLPLFMYYSHRVEHDWRRALPRWLLLAVQAIILFMEFAYLALASTSLELFDCTLLSDGQWALDADASMRCFSSDWYDLLGPAVFGVLVYALAFPFVLYQRETDENAMMRARPQLHCLVKTIQPLDLTHNKIQACTFSTVL